MISYNDLYEIIRKEKYSEALQQLPKDFISEIAFFLQEQKEQSIKDTDSLLDGAGRSKKQLENSVALFKELILRRKKKLLNLVFVATETGIMKRDYENMMSFERESFDEIVRSFEKCDKDLANLLHGSKDMEKSKQHMVIFNENIEQFMDLNGKVVGPFSSGELAHLDGDVCEILVSSGKANYVDER